MHSRRLYTSRCWFILTAMIILTTILLPATAFDATAGIAWKSGSDAAGRIDLSKAAAGQHVVVQFSEPVTHEQRSRLSGMGIGLLSYLGDNAYFATLKTGGLEPAALQALPTLTAAMAIQAEWKIDPRILANEYPEFAVAIDAETKQPRVAAYVLFHEDVSLDRGQALARHYKADVVSEIISINMLVLELPLKALLDLAMEDEVMWVEPPIPFMTVTNDSNSVRTQADTAQGAPYNLDGSGVDVLVYDGGTALQSHSDFSGRLTVRDSSGLHYHPTHVAGTIGGDGSQNSAYEGMAPAVIMQSYGFEYDGSGTFLYSNPGDIEADYDEAINTHGCDISNNSIGSNVEPNYFDCAYQGNYGATSALIDEIVGGSLGAPFRVIWAAGNERQGSRCDVEGYGDYYSLAPPSGAKNHIAVGALNSNDDSMTDFSSWGPMDDGRMKPDVSAPGCQSNDDGGVTSCDSGGGYLTICGTSMAAPTVTGLCALLLEDFRIQYPTDPDPRNSTLKILLAHNAADVFNTGPDYQSGYGSVRIVDTIDFMRSGEFEENSVSQGGSVVYTYDVTGGTSELKITLAWDDPAGTPNVNPNLVNDLDLVVMSPSSVRAYPWTLDPSNPSSAAVRSQADDTNNIEQVLVSSPEAGTWTITVQGTSVPDGPQSYSICGSPGIGVAGPADCNNNGVPDDQDISGGTSQDCNGNGVPDECDISYGISTDCNGNGIPDDCEAGWGTDCNNNGTADFCDIASGASQDCNGNSVPDDCDIGPTTVTYTWDMSSNPGWTTDGLWAYGQPTGGGGQYGDPDPTSGATGSNVYGYNLSGDYENDLSETHLTTTAIDCSGLSGVSLSFQRWLNVEQPAYDHAYLRVSNDGSSWTTIWENTAEVTDTAWSLQTHDISAVADDQAAVYIRWTQGTTDGSWQYSGWNIDDVVVSGDTSVGGPGDCNANGIPDECDIASGTSQDCNTNSVPDECDIASGTSQDTNTNGIPDECESTDCNNNGVPDDQDISGGTSQDCDGNGVPDECQNDSDGDGVIDPCDGCPTDPDKIDAGECGCGNPDTDTDGDGTPDCNDGCPSDPNKTSPGVCGCGVADTDSDGDGTPDCNDGCPNDPNKVTPGECGCGTPDTDSDADGTPDCIDGCPTDPNKTDPGTCGCGTPDTDTDGDGTPDCIDGCPDDPNKVTPGDCGCGVADTDSDGDGTPDCNDGCPNDPNKVSPGLCGCGTPDTDTDGDGTPDCNDGCPTDPNKTAPGDCGCGVPDTDSDGDGTPDCNDGCPDDPNKVTPGDCGCGTPDTDSDADGTPDCIDGCPDDPNKIDPGICGCGTPDTDTDGDGTPDCNDGCPDDPNKIVPGECGCGTPDTDSDADGTPDCLDGCPDDPNKTDPGLCGCGVPDTDSDGDGTPDCNDGCPNDPNKTDPGDCGCGAPDTDSDGDGTPDCIDGCPDDPNKVAPGDCGCGVPDTDSDGDGTADCIDGCPDDPNKTDPGACGCGVPDTDSDGDGTPDCNDGCPNDPNKVAPGDCGCGVADTDSDGDGTPDCNDGCPDDPNKVDPGICGCGTPDTDSDGDGTPDCNDGCPDDPNKTAPGDCGCGVPDTDSDGDGVADCIDGCPNDPNKTTPGDCGCGVPDTDSDGDGTADCIDGCPNDPNKTDPGACGCGIPDTDSDGDGTPDCLDGCPGDPNKVDPGICGCGTPDTDSDGDGTPDCLDGCPDDPNKTDPGICGCGTPDTDSDGDGTPDCNDGCPGDPNKTDPGVCGCGVPDVDSDGDGWFDCVDNCPSTPNSGQEDCDTDGTGDACAGEPDCNSNGTPDSCDISSGTSSDNNLNGIPDECEPTGSTLTATYTCTPSTGTVPFATAMEVSMTNNYLGLQRQFAARINVTLANGAHYPGWRTGYTNVTPGETFTTTWAQSLPAAGNVIGDNVFTLEAMDVTPAPYNQPPYPAAGDTAVDSCTVTAFAP